MSSGFHSISGNDNNENENSIAIYNRHDQYFRSTAYFTSSVVTNIQKLHTELHAQHYQDRYALNELNQRFRLFINRVQLLKSQNSRHAAQIADIQQQWSDIIDIKWNERYQDLQSNLATFRNSKVDYEFDFELSQLQIGMFRELINIEQQGKNGRRLKLELQLKESASALAILRASYAKLEQENNGLRAACEGLYQQYLRQTNNWCSMKKQRKKSELSVQALKRQLVYYKKIRSYSAQIFESMPVESIDLKQFWTLELDRCVKKIRRDFELLYESIYRQMASYYETKMEEAETHVKHAVRHQEIVAEEQAMTRQALQEEYEEVQKSLSYEKELQIKLEATYSKLESEYKAIQLRNKQQYEDQSKELHSAQENMVTLACNVDEVRRNKANLDVELIVYRHLLSSSEIQEQVVIAPQPSRSEMSKRSVVEIDSRRKGSIGIKESAASGRYISLVNHSTSRDIDISGWVLKRHVDLQTELLYTLPDGVRLQQGKELIIYSKLGAAAQSSSNNRVGAPLLQQELVSNDLDSWGMGNKITTLLLNQHGVEEASHTQSMVFGRNDT